jgi:8-oxo-dGTP diphosphatase
MPRIASVKYSPYGLGAGPDSLGHTGRVALEGTSEPRQGLRVPCVGAIITDGAGRLLLVQRGHEPSEGLWSVPGGRVEPGETDQEAVVREVREETGLVVTSGPLVGSVERPGLAGSSYVIRDYRCTVTGGVLAAGDDAAAVRWCSPAQVEALDADGLLTGELLATLRSWSVLR